MNSVATIFIGIFFHYVQLLFFNLCSFAFCTMPYTLSLTRDIFIRGSNILLAGCGMGHKVEAGCGIREISRVGYGMKIAWRDRDALISIGGIRDSFEIDGGMRDFDIK